MKTEPYPVGSTIAFDRNITFRNGASGTIVKVTDRFYHVRLADGTIVKTRATQFAS